jgi:hypothetical protein
MATPSSNYVFAFNGFLFGGPGQGIQVLEVDGLEGLPDLRIQDDSRGYQDGMFTGRDFLNGRYLSFHLQVMTDGSNTMQTYLAQLKANMAPQQQGTGVLQMYLPGRGLQRVNARVRKRALKLDPQYVYGRAEAQVEFFCPDPRIYTDTASTLSLTPANGYGRVYTGVATGLNAEPVSALTNSITSGVTTLPVDDRTGFAAYQSLTITDGNNTEVVQVASGYTQASGAGNITLAAATGYSHGTSATVSVQGRIYNLVYTSAIGGGGNIGTASNAGNTTTFPTITITGPCTNPVITNQGTGAYIGLSVTLAGSDVVVIDPDLRSITLNGSPARNLLTNGSTWWGLVSGSTTIGFIAPTYATGASLSLSWRSAYI